MFYYLLYLIGYDYYDYDNPNKVIENIKKVGINTTCKEIMYSDVVSELKKKLVIKNY